MSDTKPNTIWPISKAWDHYRALSLHPTPTSAQVIESEERITLTCQYNYRDYFKYQDINTEKTFLINPNSLKVEYTSPHYTTTSKHRVWSPSGKLLAEIIQITENGEKFEFLEVTEGTNRVLTLNLTAAEKHGPVTDQSYNFGRLCWSSSEEFVSYIAESVQKSKEEDPEKPKVYLKSKESNLYSQSWGEKQDTTSHTVLCMVSVSSGDIDVLNSPGFSSAQPAWNTTESKLACVQYAEEPYRLGLYYCLNRGCRIVICTINSGKLEESIVLGDCSQFVAGLIFRGSDLFYLSSTSPGPHRQPQRFIHYDLETGSEKCLVGTEDRGDFPGIYTLDSVCLTLEGQWAVISSEDGFEISPFLINLVDGQVLRLRSDCEAFPCVSVLCATNSLLVCCLSSPSTPPRIAVGRISDGELLISWSVVHTSPDYDCPYEILSHSPLNGHSFESMFMKPPGKCPLVVFAHGGPHSCYSASFNCLRATLFNCGFALLMVNYRGSTGYGGDFLKSLLGKIGESDVADVRLAILDVLAENSEVMGDSLHYVGGSHGGFIGAHFVAKYPKWLKSACLLNPVVDPSSMAAVTDIPDWCFWECGLPFDHKRTSCFMDYEPFYRASVFNGMVTAEPGDDQGLKPISVCLMIGGSDRRVPPSQGLEFYKKLKANSVNVKLYYYPNDGHALGSVSTAADVFCNNYLTIYNQL